SSTVREDVRADLMTRLALPRRRPVRPPDRGRGFRRTHVGCAHGLRGPPGALPGRLGGGGARAVRALRAAPAPRRPPPPRRPAAAAVRLDGPDPGGLGVVFGRRP